jgi:hypothetical protein
MRPSFYLFVVALVASAILTNGCSGGKSILASGGPTGGTTSGARLVLSGTIDGTGPQLLAHVRRPLSGPRHTMAFTFNHILVQGTLYPGDASDNIVTNSTTIPVPGSGIYSASLAFSNVPVHNNEWGMLQFIGVAADGSQIALGELAGIINVTASPTNSSTLTEATTRTFQVFTTLLTNGEIGTNDLDNAATLASTLTTQIGAAAFDPTTHLFNASELVTLYENIAPKFERNVTITSSPAVNGTFFLLRDYTNASELDLTSNLTNLATINFNVQPPVIGSVLGGSATSCGSFAAAAPLHSPETNPAPIPSSVSSCVLAGNGSTTVYNVYGGHLLIGADNRNPFSTLAPTPPFNGGFTSFAGHAPGTFSVSVPTGLTQKSIKVTDPAGFAFGAGFFSGPSVSPGLGTFFEKLSVSGASLQASTTTPIRISIPATYNSTSNTITVDTLNAWDVSAANQQLCGGISCFALSAAQPFVIRRPFADNGTNLTYFNWKTSGTATAISQVSPNGYKVTISGAGNATLTTTTASVLLPRQQVFIDENSAIGTTWTVTAKDTAGNTYSNFGPAVFGNTVTVVMNSLGNTVTTTSIAVSFPTTAAGTTTVFFIED